MPDITMKRERTAYASRIVLPPSLQGSLPAGWLSLYREGVEPSGSLQKVSDHPSSFSGLSLAQGKFHFEPSSRFTSFDHLVGVRLQREAERPKPHCRRLQETAAATERPRAPVLA